MSKPKIRLNNITGVGISLSTAARTDYIPISNNILTRIPQLQKDLYLMIIILYYTIVAIC